ncbi:up-regulator of cell proliferation-like, partial [Acanthopagrus schlegelii]
TVLFNFLSKLGLKEFYPNKITLQSLLEINKNSLSDETVQSVEEIPWCFLRKLFKINADCRSCAQLSSDDDEEDENDDPFSQDLYTAGDSADDNVNPLDLIVALFLCADGSLQQEMALKMSMCQFSVPLLLPDGHNSQCTLMLWALRDIVKEWRPHDLSESRGFVEDNIVQADIPFFSFVRLKNCSLSKSQCLNHVLSLGQQHHNIVIHRKMKGGANARKIANGLVEVCWFLPCGNRNLDTFSKPVAFANLRGDICESLKQFSFLCQVSTATFVFLDKVEENEHKILTSLQDVKSKLFLVVNHKADNAKEDMKSVKATKEELDLPNSNVKIKDSTVNVAEFSEKLCQLIKKSMTVGTAKISIENMVAKAAELGLSVDEGTSDRQKKAAKEIIDGIGVRSIPDYKKQQLPLQGENWKRLSQLEREECRLKKAEDQRLEEYKSQLQEEKQQIKKKLCKHKQSGAMKSFIKHLSESDKEKRDFFLNWMKIKLNAHLRFACQLSLLRHKLAEHGNNKEKDVKERAELDQALVESSLGIEHYMREMGLIYEFSSQSEDPADKVSDLPGLAAEMLLDGHPLELLDGDASNIPERWLTDVLMELHRKVGQKSKLLVLTVLGVQSSGKSTLLNTMFGVQFPVSSGRCTRGAYMLFLRMGEDIREELNYDFIVLIDTEGLKCQELAQLEDSYEHDNELATFVIGLSDITIINVSMENSTEMKDVLQIAAHAFLRMKEIGKKPVCHFVHQNVGGVSAHAKTMTERKYLLDQLNQMTQIAAEMESRPLIKSFTDVLDYDIQKNNWNIPGLWNGTPPMAPVNKGYSEAVADFKKNLLETVKGDRSDELSQIPEFLEWMKSLWKAVKYENFIFSFRNTLIAHAYDNLCKEFNQWEWEFRKEILTWQKAAELEIFNTDNRSELHYVKQLADFKKSKLPKEIEVQQTTMTEKLKKYYKRKDRHVHLIEKYKTDFLNSVISLAKEIQHSVSNKLDCALEQWKSSKEAQVIQRKHREVIQEQVMKLLSDCKHRTLSDEELTQEFEKMWTEVTADVSGLKEQDIAASILQQLRKKFENRKLEEEWQKIKDLNEIGKGAFKYNIQKELLLKEDFKSFVKYICKYEIYVKDWIFQHLQQKMSEDKTLCKLKNKTLQVIVQKITEATEKASKGEDGAQLPDDKESITVLINNMREYLIKDILISEDAEQTTMFQIQSTCHPFTKSLIKSLSDLNEQLQEEFSNSEDITETLNKLPIKPQDELFKQVFGCGQQCPFCKVPCEAGGKRHKKHHAAVHRPKGLGRCRYEDTEKLVPTLCTTSVHSECKFRNTYTKWNWHPYKEYTTYYPDWQIPPDSSIEASDYWKYVLVKYNDRFAQEYKAKPADVPEAWRRITKEQALKGLKDAFNIM